MALAGNQAIERSNHATSAIEPVSPPPSIPDHELLRRIGRGAYGEVWLARNVMGAWRAVKVIGRAQFLSERPYEREFEGIRRFGRLRDGGGGFGFGRTGHFCNSLSSRSFFAKKACARVKVAA